jgi:hypothetical protein
MNGSVSVAVALLLLTLAPPADLQVTHRPTPAPTVTAENESWYVDGKPVMYSGNIYHPAGPQVHFNGNEMVRSGFFHGIPLYIRTTIEPYSKVFVPLSGGMMQPYERRRDGDLAGTVGSTAPAFPVARSSEPVAEPGIPHAPASPGLIGSPEGAVASVGRAHPASEPAAAVGTAGRNHPAAPSAVPAHSRPRAHEGLFLDFKGQRWFSEGTAIPLDRSQLTRIGEHHGFPVYARTGRMPATIYVPVSREAGEFVAPYSRRVSR